MRLALAILFLSLTASAATPSYWWSQMIVKPDAKQSQEFFFVPGTNMVFTYATNRVILNSGGGGGTTYITNNFYVTNTIYVTNYTVGLNTNICVMFCDGSTNLLNITNGLIVAINGSFPPVHGPSWIWPNGGHILWPNGGYISLP